MSWYSNDTELATVPEINNTNIIRETRLNIDSWIGYGYYFYHAKVFKILIEKRGWVPVCYNEEKEVIVNTVKKILNK